MIRRQSGNDWLMITQADHAAVAARLVGHVGGRRFSPVSVHRASVLAAVAAHDQGWATSDDCPGLDASGRPLDFTDAAPELSLAAWAASTPAVALASGSYAGLLVSLHALASSIAALGRSASAFDLSDPQTVFAVNQFQHREIERQEALREAIGLPTDIPLTHGVAEQGISDGDDTLVHALRLLQAMDLLSLALCCTHLPAEETGEVLPTPTSSPKKLSMMRDVHRALRVRPWPFDAAQLDLTIPCRRLPARPFANVADFRAAYASAAVERYPVTLRP